MDGLCKITRLDFLLVVVSSEIGALVLPPAMCGECRNLVRKAATSDRNSDDRKAKSRINQGG